MIIVIIYWYSWKFSELISVLLFANHTRSWKTSLEWNGRAISNTTVFLEDPLAVSFLYLWIYFSYNYFKYQRSQAESCLFRNQISFVIFAIMLQKTCQKQ